MSKTQTTSAKVLALVANGMNPLDALKTVCGADAVDTMIDTLYNELRTKGGR